MPIDPNDIINEEEVEEEQSNENVAEQLEELNEAIEAGQQNQDIPGGGIMQVEDILDSIKAGVSEEAVGFFNDRNNFVRSTVLLNEAGGYEGKMLYFSCLSGTRSEGAAVIAHVVNILFEQFNPIKFLCKPSQMAIGGGIYDLSGRKSPRSIASFAFVGFKQDEVELIEKHPLLQLIAVDEGSIGSKVEKMFSSSELVDVIKQYNLGHLDVDNLHDKPKLDQSNN